MTTISSIFDGRNKRLEGFSYKLATGQYGLDVAIQDHVDLDESTMSVTIPFADGNRRDGVGDLLEVAGINTERHRVNPIILFDHGKQVSLPIALAEDPETKTYTVQVDPSNRSAKAKAFFYQGGGSLTGGQGYDHALFCEQLFDLIAKRYIRAGSIGYQIVHAKQLQPDYERGTPAGLHLLSILMLECSAVVLPANGDTVRKMLSIPRVCGKVLSPMLVKSLTPYLPTETKTVTGYEQKKVNIDKIVKESGDEEALKQIYSRIRDILAGQGRHKKKKKKKKSLDDIRLKYRAANNRRWKMRRSSPGKSVILVYKKDVERSQEEAESKGLKYDRIGSVGKNIEKIRLSGDDSSIDAIAKKYGRAVKSNRTGRSGNMSKQVKSMKVHTKAGYKDPKEDEVEPVSAPEESTDEGPPPDPELKGAGTEDEVLDDTSDLDIDDEGGEEETLEPFGAQVLRRVHQDHSVLMQDYDEMIQVLEHEGVKKHMEKLLEGLDTILTSTEDLFGDNYQDLEGLSGAGDEEDKDLDAEDTGEEEPVEEESGGDEDTDTMDDAGVAASSGDSDEEEPTPEEALEGMDKEKADEEDDEVKEPKKKSFSEIRNKYRKGGVCKCGKTPCVCKKKDKTLKGKKKSDPGSDDWKEEEAKEPEHQEPPKAEEKPKDENSAEEKMVKSLEDYERKAVGEAAGFLDETSKETNFGDEHRMKSYHYHKTLEPIGAVEGSEDEKMAPLVAAGIGAVAGSMSGGDKAMTHRRTVGAASAFLGELSRERAFGDSHRQKCGSFCKALKEIGEAKEDDAKKEEESAETTPEESAEATYEPGEVEEKAFLMKLYKEQDEAVSELKKKMERLEKFVV